MGSFLEPSQWGSSKKHSQSSFAIDNLSIYLRIFFKFFIHICIKNEWFGIVSGQNQPIFDRVTALWNVIKKDFGL